MRTKLSLYWLCQICGWGIAALYWSLYQIVGEDSFLVGALTVVFLLLMGIGSTHFYKLRAHAWGWPNLDLWKLLPRMGLALLALTSIYLVVCLLVITWAFGRQDTDAILGMLTGGIRYMTIWLLAFHLYHFAGSRRKAEIDQKRFENLALSAKYDRLNAELNPHFLFNSLNSIKALILEDKDKARTAVDTLSTMLRHSLKLTDKVTIPLEEEIRRIKAYIELEKIRFEERLEVVFEVNEKLLSHKVPPLCIYNLVENAIIHGLDKSKKGVRIEIKCDLIDDFVHLQVKSNTSLKEGWSYGKGLTNIKERLDLIYNKEAALTVAEEGPFVFSKILIPRNL